MITLLAIICIYLLKGQSDASGSYILNPGAYTWPCPDPFHAQQCPFLPGRTATICHYTNYTVLDVDILLSGKLPGPIMLKAISMKISYCENLSLSWRVEGVKREAWVLVVYFQGWSQNTPAFVASSLLRVSKLQPPVLVWRWDMWNPAYRDMPVHLCILLGHGESCSWVIPLLLPLESRKWYQNINSSNA